MYKKVVKRILDFVVSLVFMILLSPVYLILTLFGAYFMKGNPFFIQKRPGRNEVIFNMIKFRTMTNEKDADGELLSDNLRLNKYGNLLRKTSLDELPEFINILKGDMSFVGPRPLLVEYLPYYTEDERHRHDIRPGLTGLAQINGRNMISNWEERFSYDLEYINKCSFIFDLRIIFMTVYKVIKKSDIKVGKEIPAGRLDDVRKKERAYANIN